MRNSYRAILGHTNHLLGVFEYMLGGLSPAKFDMWYITFKFLQNYCHEESVEANSHIAATDMSLLTRALTAGLVPLRYRDRINIPPSVYITLRVQAESEWEVRKKAANLSDVVTAFQLGRLSLTHDHISKYLL